MTLSPEMTQIADLISSFSDEELDEFNGQLGQLVGQKQLQDKINQNPSYLDLFKEGLQESSGNLVTQDIPGFKQIYEYANIEPMPTLKEEAARGERDLGFLQNLAKGAGAMLGDTPAMFVGGVAGGLAGAELGPGALITGGAGAFAMPTLLKTSHHEYQKFFDENPDADVTFGEYLEAAGNISKETGKSAVIGGATAMVAPLVGFLSKVPGFQKLFSSKAIRKAAESIGESATITTGTAAFQGEWPDADQFAQNLLLLAGFHGTKAGARKFGEWARGKGLSQSEAIEILDNLDEEQMRAFDAAESIDDIIDPKQIEQKSKQIEVVEKPKKIEFKEPIKEEVKKEPVKEEVKKEEPVPEEFKDVDFEPEKKEVAKIEKKEEPKQEVQLEGEMPKPETLEPAEGDKLVKFKRAEAEEPVKDASYFENIHKRVKAVTNRFNKFWNVEAPFKEAGGDETGRKAKLYYNTIEKHQRDAIDLIKAIKKLGYDRRDRGILTLLSEGKTLPEKYKEKYGEGYDLIRKYFDSSFKELKEVDALTKPFPESLIDRIQKENEEILKKIKETKGVKTRTSLNEKLKKNNIAIRRLKDAAFVHIPYSEWFTDMYGSGKSGQRIINAINSLTNKQRKSISIGDLLNSKAIKAEQIDISDIIGSYGLRKGKDLAIYGMMKEAVADGLASKKPMKNYEKIPKWASNVANQFYVHPVVYDYLIPILKREPSSLNNLLGMIKGYQFYNPLFLPGYDLFQAAMLGSFNPVRPFRTGRYFAKAAKDIYYRTKDYHEAMEEGLASSPFNITKSEYNEIIKRTKQSLPENIMDWMSPKILGKIYNLSSDLAWQGDRWIRMASYNRLIEMGHSPKDAAEIAATFHADYASVPAMSRRKLNKIFFTPTFKVAMGKLFKTMAKSTYKAGKAVLKGEKIDPKDRVYAEGLVNAAVISGAMDIFFKANGFERDIFAYRYSKPVKTEDGEDKEIVVVMPSPINLPIKYIGRAYQSFTDPGEINAWSKFARQMSWEIHPLWRMAYNVIANQSESGSPITDIIANTPGQRMFDRTKYIMNSMMPWTQISEVDDESEKSRAEMEKELGQLFGMVFRPFTNHYIRDSFEKRTVGKIKKLVDDLRSRQIRSVFDPKTDPLNEEQIERYLNQIQKVVKQLDEYRQNKEK
jgi:hypothetical protein